MQWLLVLLAIGYLVLVFSIATPLREMVSHGLLSRLERRRVSAVEQRNETAERVAIYTGDR